MQLATETRGIGQPAHHVGVARFGLPPVYRRVMAAAAVFLLLEHTTVAAGFTLLCRGECRNACVLVARPQKPAPVLNKKKKKTLMLEFFLRKFLQILKLGKSLANGKERVRTKLMAEIIEDVRQSQR